MGAEQPMMRARQRGRSCRVPGHGDWCEVSTERPTHDRAFDARAERREIDEQRTDP